MDFIICYRRPVHVLPVLTVGLIIIHINYNFRAAKVLLAIMVRARSIFNLGPAKFLISNCGERNQLPYSYIIPIWHPQPSHSHHLSSFHFNKLNPFSVPSQPSIHHPSPAPTDFRKWSQILKLASLIEPYFFLASSHCWHHELPTPLLTFPCIAYESSKSCSSYPSRLQVSTTHGEPFNNAKRNRGWTGRDSSPCSPEIVVQKKMCPGMLFTSTPVNQKGNGYRTKLRYHKNPPCTPN